MSGWIFLLLSPPHPIKGPLQFLGTHRNNNGGAPTGSISLTKQNGTWDLGCCKLKISFLKIFSCCFLDVFKLLKRDQVLKKHRQTSNSIWNPTRHLRHCSFGAGAPTIATGKVPYSWDRGNTFAYHPSPLLKE